MTFELKTLSPNAVPSALEKARLYRLLNEPGEAESICLDVLDIDAGNQDALVMLLLALTVIAIRGGLNGSPALGLALFIAGGASNWVDRVVRGSVVDFVNVGIGSVRTGVFNVADVAIMIGAVVFVLGQFRKGR